MARKLKYSKEVKIQACKDYENGSASFYSIASEIGTTKEMVRRWCLKYKEYGSNVFSTNWHCLIKGNLKELEE